MTTAAAANATDTRPDGTTSRNTRASLAESHDACEGAQGKVPRFMNAAEPGDEIMLTQAEHRGYTHGDL